MDVLYCVRVWFYKIAVTDHALGNLVHVRINFFCKFRALFRLPCYYARSSIVNNDETNKFIGFKHFLDFRARCVNQVAPPE